MKIKIVLFGLLISLVTGCIKSSIKNLPYNIDNLDKPTQEAYLLTHEFLQSCIKTKTPVEVSPFTKIDTIIIDDENKEIAIHFNRFLNDLAFREKNTNLIYNDLKNRYEDDFKDFHLTVYTMKHTIEDLIPNFFRTDKSDYDLQRMPVDDIRPVPLIRNLNRNNEINKGLDNRYIALWPSHGWYYENRLDRWEWQRARVFETVEDLLPFSFVEPYLIPMLENSGAMVFLPRERDIQSREIIVDNDSNLEPAYVESAASSENNWQTADSAGFAIGHPPYVTSDNPFHDGTSRFTKVSNRGESVIKWIPEFQEKSKYAVYITYNRSDSNITDAHYTVNHLGGKTEFLVNQQIGGNTWIYLGKFLFDKGQSEEKGSVILTNQSNEEGVYVSADGVKFGGGMGNVARNGQISKRPRFSEAARYYLQYAGFPDTLVYNLNGDSLDYNDDYQCRGEWVNYLKGSPFGPNRNRQAAGLRLPIDLSFAFHTDAGYTRNDTVIGTLMIYSSWGADTQQVFPDSMSRLASRDLGDIMQTQLVEDIREKYDPIWNRRYLWDRNYSEAYRPNVPAVLLELLSHHNFLDMKFALDPRFRFDVSRSIYKAMLKFIATQHSLEYVVQPLPVTHFQTEFIDKSHVHLKWLPQSDPLEPTANPKQFKVYIRREGSDFDQGVITADPMCEFDLPENDVIYSFKVTALNAGGESFPSEILSVCRSSMEKGEVLIVNGFDRVSAPATLESGHLLGFADFWDQGIPDKYDFKYIGRQYDFDADSPWLDDDSPGHGASYGNYETKVVAGNTFDYPNIHGQSFRNAGYSFISASDESVMDSMFNMNDYNIVDLILGEEKTTDWPKPHGDKQFAAFPAKFQKRIKSYCITGHNLFVSGAYIGTDLYSNSKDSVNIRFAEETLKYKFRTNYAVKTGKLHSVDGSFFPVDSTFEFCTELNPNQYAVEAPDAIEAADSARTIMRYSENNTSAVVAFDGKYKVVSMGFPFESITSAERRDIFLKYILDFFDGGKETHISLSK